MIMYLILKHAKYSSAWNTLYYKIYSDNILQYTREFIHIKIVST